MKTWARITKTAGLCLLILLICYFANHILNTNVRKYDSTATTEADGSQVLFAGTSQGYNGINPLVLWDEHGIESYNFCAAGQYIGTTYYVLKDALEHQNPSVIVLDFESITRPEDFLTISHKLYSMPMIAGLRNRYAMYRDIIGESPVYFIPMLRYHNRWKEITKMDFRQDYDILGSGRLLMTQDQFQDLPVPYFGETEPMGEAELKFLNQILALTQEHDCQLVLLDMPSYSSDPMEAITKAVKEWAAEHDVLVCEANQLAAFQSMNLMPQDFADDLHLNITGQYKLSLYLGSWLLANSSASDHRGMEAGYYWEDRMPQYRYLANDGKLIVETDMAEYFRLLKQGNYTVAITLTGNYKTESEELWPILEGYGFTREDYERGGSFVYDPEGACLFNSAGSDSYRWTKVLDADDLILRGSSYKDELGNRLPRIELLFDRSDQTRTSDGVNVLVYNHSTVGMIESIGFGAEDNYQIIR